LRMFRTVCRLIPDSTKKANSELKLYATIFSFLLL
jgi:hypothetical protein